MESAESVLKQILFGGDLGDKLAGSSLSFRELVWEPSCGTIVSPDAPGRSGNLIPVEQASTAFPKKSEMKDERARGRLLHFFANHELLAIETMALVLLKFPDAPESFKQGVFRTLQDEQRHLKAYLTRMEEYGVPFGGVPLNLYFWNTLKSMESPLDFVTRMSLTFEQANLDFALEYARYFEEEMDDERTAVLLREVHDDEVKHVAHGWKWFQEWKNPAGVSDFEAYRKSLPFPMSPRRARGGALFAEQSRLDAGLTPDFVRQVKVAGGSRGRVPNYYHFNPQCDLEAQGVKLSAAVRAKICDLEPLIVWLGLEEDVAGLSSKPDSDFLERVHEIRGVLPEISLGLEDRNRFQAFEEFRPWGYSKSAWDFFGELKSRVRKQPGFGQNVHSERWFHKAFWKEALGTPGFVIRSENDCLRFLDQAGRNGDWLLKSSEGTSGRGHLKIESSMLPDPTLRTKIVKRLELGSFVIEPFYEKAADFSVQYEIFSDGRVQEFAPRLFKIDDHFQYQGALLGQGWQGSEFEGLLQKILSEKKSWEPLHQRVIEILKEGRYVGPLGIDCMLCKDGAIVPVIEVNVRFTMGRVAHEIERAARRLQNFRNGIWVFMSESNLVAHGCRNFVELDTRFKREFGSRYFATTPALSSKGTFTFALVNPSGDELKAFGFKA
jgi:uncharacterized ferritin-like protein (DUF455 family)